MSNNRQQTAVEWLINKHFGGIENVTPDFKKHIEQAKEMQQEQAQLYASFVLKCVQNNLPPITFNDWINLENNEQQ